MNINNHFTLFIDVIEKFRLLKKIKHLKKYFNEKNLYSLCSLHPRFIITGLKDIFL